MKISNAVARGNSREPLLFPLLLLCLVWDADRKCLDNQTHLLLFHMSAHPEDQ